MGTIPNQAGAGGLATSILIGSRNANRSKNCVRKCACNGSVGARNPHSASVGQAFACDPPRVAEWRDKARLIQLLVGGAQCRMRAEVCASRFAQARIQMRSWALGPNRRSGRYSRVLLAGGDTTGALVNDLRRVECSGCCPGIAYDLGWSAPHGASCVGLFIWLSYIPLAFGVLRERLNLAASLPHCRSKGACDAFCVAGLPWVGACLSPMVASVASSPTEARQIQMLTTMASFGICVADRGPSATQVLQRNCKHRPPSYGLRCCQA